jgi:hypothetical protein
MEHFCRFIKYVSYKNTHTDLHILLVTEDNLNPNAHKHLLSLVYVMYIRFHQKVNNHSTKRTKLFTQVQSI